MKKSILVLFLATIFMNSLSAQGIVPDTIINNFNRELYNFPQEKIYLQTDRNIYMSGETMWFRAHLVDALLLKQANASRYVYVTLTSPSGKLLERVKVRPDSQGYFYGSIRIEENSPQGYYSLEAYTWFMQNIGQDYFFNKKIFISDPNSKLVRHNVKFSSDEKNIIAEIKYLKNGDNTNIIPENSIISPDFKKNISLTFIDGKAQYSFRKKEIDPSRMFLLKTLYDGKPINSYVRIPQQERPFQVDFFPEGGNAPYSTDIKIAFKAVGTNGLSKEIKGTVVDENNQECANFSTLHLGMGFFRMHYEKGKRYHAICIDDSGKSLEFDLPMAKSEAIAINTAWTNKKLRVSIAKSEETTLPPSMMLVAHIRGVVLYAQPWDANSNFLDFDEDFFPAGITHFLLIDGNRNIHSERLVFSLPQQSLARTSVIFDKNSYNKRDKIDMDIALSDFTGSPLKGNFSISITDMKDVQQDTTSNIVSSMLLTSELKGYIESPLSYLNSNKNSSFLLDLLMMAQGWRRYNIPEIIKGNNTNSLRYEAELGEKISGKVNGYFSALKGGKISLLAVKDSLIGTEMAEVDGKGKFVFDKLDYPNGSHFIVQAQNKKGSSKVFIELDSLKSYPQPLLFSLPPFEEPEIKESYLTKMDQKYTIENGMRVYNLAEIVVTAKRKRTVFSESPFYSPLTSKVLTEDDVNEGHFVSIFDLLRRLPGVSTIGDEVQYRGKTPMVILDNVPEESFDYQRINVEDVKEVFISPATSVAAFYGSAAANGALIINTKKGFVQRNRLNSNMQVAAPIGYQQYVEFYSPTYETEAKKGNTTPDLRTTIYWNPSVVTDENGKAHISFYAADATTNYGFTIEGVASNGNLIYSVGKTSVGDLP